MQEGIDGSPADEKTYCPYRRMNFPVEVCDGDTDEKAGSTENRIWIVDHGIRVTIKILSNAGINATFANPIAILIHKEAFTALRT